VPELIRYWAISLVLPFLAAEVALRFFAPLPAKNELYVVDSVLGWRLRPSVSQQFSDEGVAVVTTNSAGFRDREQPLIAPAGQLRVAFLGDSFLEAKQLPYEQTVVAIAEAELQSCLGKPVSAMNFSAQGYGTTQQLLLYREEVRKYSPDVVVLAFYEGNDVFDNHPELKLGNPELAPYADVDGITTLGVGPYFFWRASLQWLGVYLQVARRVQSLSYFAPKARALSDEEYEWALLRFPLQQQLIDAWSTTEKLIAQVAAEVTADGSKFVVVSIPPAIAVHPNQQLQRDFKQRYGVADFNYVRGRLSEFLRSKSIPYHSLQDSLSSEARDLQKPVYGFLNSRPGFGHLNEHGHRSAAESISAVLCPMLKVATEEK
jgi:hypothetical protein